MVTQKALIILTTEYVFFFFFHRTLSEQFLSIKYQQKVNDFSDDTYSSSFYLLAIAGLLVFSSYRVEDGDDVGRTVCKIGCAGNRRLMDVHGVRVLKDREAARYINISETHTTGKRTD